MTVLKPIEIDKEDNLLANGDKVFDIVSRIRQFKSENKLSLKTELEDVTISDKDVDFIKSCEMDIKAVSSAHEIKYQNGEYNVVIGAVVEQQQ